MDKQSAFNIFSRKRAAKAKHNAVSADITPITTDSTAAAAPSAPRPATETPRRRTIYDGINISPRAADIIVAVLFLLTLGAVLIGALL